MKKISKYLSLIVLVFALGANVSSCTSNSRSAKDAIEKAAEWLDDDSDSDDEDDEDDDNSKSKGKSLDDAIEEAAESLDRDGNEEDARIKLKLDTLGATVKAQLSGKEIDNRKFAEIEKLHLRIALELRFYMYPESKPELLRLFQQYTGGDCGGHPYNRNWVSEVFKYDEARDFEYVDPTQRYPFDESNPLPTAQSNVEDIANELLN